MANKNYYPIGTYQIVLYDENDEPLKKIPFDGPLYEAQQIADRKASKKKYDSAKVFRAVYDTKYNVWVPKNG